MEQPDTPPLVSLADDVIVAAPLRIADMTSGLIGGEDGRVYIYNGKHTIFGDVTGKCKSWMSPCPEEKVAFSCTPLLPQGSPFLQEPGPGVRTQALGCVSQVQSSRTRGHTDLSHTCHCPATSPGQLHPLPPLLYHVLSWT